MSKYQYQYQPIRYSCLPFFHLNEPHDSHVDERSSSHIHRTYVSASTLIYLPQLCKDDPAQGSATTPCPMAHEYSYTPPRSGYRARWFVYYQDATVLDKVRSYEFANSRQKRKKRNEERKVERQRVCRCNKDAYRYTEYCERLKTR